MNAWKWIVALETVVLAVLVALVLRGAPPSDAGPATPPSPDPEPAAASMTVAAPTKEDVAAAPARAELAPAAAEPRFLVYGQVADAQGRPLKDAYVAVALASMVGRGGRVATMQGGRYAVAGLSAADWRLTVGADDHRPHVETVTLTPAAPVARRDFVLTPAIVLQVRVRTPEGQPLEAVVREAGASGELDFRVEPHAAAFTGPPPPGLPMSDTRSTLGVGVGEFHSRWFHEKKAGEPADCIGTLELRDDPPVHVALLLRHLTLASQVVAPGTSEVVFELTLDALRAPLGSIRLRVVDGDSGAPIEGARVDVTDRQGGFTSGRPPEGNVVVRPGIPPGRWTVSIHKKDYEPVDQVVRLEPRQDLDLGDVALHQARALRGVVLDAVGRPVHATLRWDPLDRRRFAQPLRNNHIAEADAEGEFTLQVGRGRYAVHAATETAAVHVLVDVGAEPPPRLELRLQPTFPVRLQNEITDREFYLVSIRTRDGVPVYGEELRRGSPGPIRLPRGDYVVDVHRDVTPVRSYELQVGEGEAVLRVP